MRKLSARWVPRLLTADHKRARVVASEQCLGMFQCKSKEFLRRYVTVDETWIHYYTPETKNQSKMWTGPGEFASKKAKTVPSAGKVMATIFWGSHGIILIDYHRREKLLQESIMPHYWIDSMPFERKSGLIWRKKSAFPPWQCTRLHECHCNGQIIWFTLRNTSSSTLFPRFGSFRLFFVS